MMKEKTKIYKVELMVVDYNNQLDEEQVRYCLEDTKYVYPLIYSIKQKEIEEWDDDNPLNQKDTWKQEFEKLFKEE